MKLQEQVTQATTIPPWQSDVPIGHTRGRALPRLHSGEVIGSGLMI